MAYAENNPENLHQISKRFYRADKTCNHQTDWIGLGLSLGRSILELYGGSMTISSAGIDQGTTVTLMWPLTIYPSDVT